MQTPTFVDSKGRKWLVEIHPHAMKRVREMTGVKIGEWANDKFQPLAELLADAERLCDVLYVLCKDAADAAGVSDEDFGRAMGGDALEAAADALVAAYANFSRSQARPLILALRTKGREFAAKLAAATEARLNAIDVDAIVSATLNASAGNSPASSASTPAG